MRTAARIARTVRSRAGFTLVEMMVALAVSSIIMVGMFATFNDVQRSWRSSRQEVSSVRNERAGVQMMVRELRMAGSGYGGRTIVAGGVPQNRLYPIDPKPGLFGDPDTLTITAGINGVSTVTTAILASPSDAIPVVDASIFAVGDYVIITNSIEADMFRVTGTGAGTTIFHTVSDPMNDPVDHDLWPASGYAKGSTVVRVRRVTYWVDADAVPPRLVRRMDSGNPLPISAGVMGLRFQYVLADGSVSGAPADPSLIRSVLLDYVPRAVNAPGSINATPTAGDTMSVRIQPRVLG